MFSTMKTLTNQIVTNGHHISQFYGTLPSMDLLLSNRLSLSPTPLTTSLQLDCFTRQYHKFLTGYSGYLISAPKIAIFCGDVHTALSVTVYTTTMPNGLQFNPANFSHFHAETDDESENNNTHFAS